MKRFLLYGFLKNMRFFDAFKVLSWLSKGLSFFQVGILYSVGDIVTTVLEIPTGLLADVYVGRKNCMIFSLLCYIVSFILFGKSSSYSVLMLAMVLFSVGAAFLSGTAKSMQFAHLVHVGQQHRRTELYGAVRSWAKISSAATAVVSPIIVIFSNGDYNIVWYASVLPYFLNIINIMTYPKHVDGDEQEREKRKKEPVWSSFASAFKLMFSKSSIRRLLFESVCSGTAFGIAKQYIQPLVETFVLLSVVQHISIFENSKNQVAVFMGIVYCILNMIGAIASRLGAYLKKKRSENEAVEMLWWFCTTVYCIISIVIFVDWTIAGIALYMLLFLHYNSFRPLHLSRFDIFVSSSLGSTALSIENQVKASALIVIEPVVGWIVDRTSSFWIVGVLGFVSCVPVVISIAKYRSVLEDDEKENSI
ncbi:hypothetical protein PCE1_002585 [Barthelona sp. PCE]